MMVVSYSRKPGWLFTEPGSKRPMIFLRAVTKADSSLAISHGYLAVVDMFLYRDPSENAASALKLSKSRSAGRKADDRNPCQVCGR